MMSMPAKFFDVAAKVLAALVVVALFLAIFFFFAWFADQQEITNMFMGVLKVIVSPTVTVVIVIAGLIVWALTRYDEEIRDLIPRIQKFGNVEFAPPLSGTESIKPLPDPESPQSSASRSGKGDSEHFNDLLAAAEKGNRIAQFNLGVSYYHGQGTPPNRKEAAKWFHEAASGDAPIAQAQCALGVLYANGEEVAQDYAKAAEWYLRAAKQGIAQAQNNLGTMYDTGEGVPLDRIDAATWFRRAAEQGYAEAQCNLGTACYHGQGVPKDPVEAATWFRRAAEQGIVQAQNNLGVLYDNGEGGVQDYKESYIWFSLASAGGHAKASQSRDKAARRLSPADLASAQAEITRRHGEIKNKRRTSGK